MFFWGCCIICLSVYMYMLYAYMYMHSNIYAVSQAIANCSERVGCRRLAGQQGSRRSLTALPLLSCCFSAAVPLLFCCRSTAILPSFLRPFAAILPSFCRFSAGILLSCLSSSGIFCYLRFYILSLICFFFLQFFCHIVKVKTNVSLRLVLRLASPSPPSSLHTSW